EVRVRRGGRASVGFELTAGDGEAAVSALRAGARQSAELPAFDGAVAELAAALEVSQLGVLFVDGPTEDGPVAVRLGVYDVTSGTLLGRLEAEAARELPALEADITRLVTQGMARARHVAEGVVNTDLALPV